MADDENIKVHSDENLEIISTPDETGYYTRDGLSGDFARTQGNKIVSQADLDSAKTLESSSNTTTQSEMSVSGGVQQFDAYYGFDGGDFAAEFAKAGRSAVLQYVTGTIPRLTSEMIDAVARDQTKHMVELLFRGSKPAPNYIVNVGIRYKKDKNDIEGDYKYFRNVQKFGGINFRPLPSPREALPDPTGVANITQNISFGLTHLKDILAGNKGSWKEFQEFLDDYSTIARAQATGKEIEVDAIVQFEPFDEPKFLKGKLPFSDKKYRYDFKFEACKLKDIGFQRLSRWSNTYSAVANFNFEANLTGIETVVHETGITGAMTSSLPGVGGVNL